MTTLSRTFHRIKSRYPRTTTIETTLYDLIEAISGQVLVGEDHLIAQTVFQLIDTGKLKFIGIPKEFNSTCK